MNLQESVDTIFPPSKDYGVLAPIHLSPVGEDIPTLLRSAEFAKRASNTVHVGFAGLANIDFVLAAHVKGVVLCDLNQNQVIFWKELFGIIHESRSAVEAKNTLRQKLRRNSAQSLQFYSGADVLDVRHGNNIFEILSLSWLNEPRKFSELKAIVDSGCAAAVVLDCCDVEGATLINQCLSDSGMGVATLYLSNLRNMFIAEGQPDFYKRAGGGSRARFEGAVSVLSTEGVTKILDGSVPIVGMHTRHRI
jgi:hypothetical protein